MTSLRIKLLMFLHDLSSIQIKQFLFLKPSRMMMSKPILDNLSPTLLLHESSNKGIKHNVKLLNFWTKENFAVINLKF